MIAGKKKKKINLSSFDLAKGLGIMAVVLMHMLPQYDLQRVVPLGWLYKGLHMLSAGVMPMFYIASGYSFKPKSSGKMAKKSFSELVKPYLFVMLAVGILFPLCHYLTFRWLPGALTESTRFVLAFALGVATSGKAFLGYILYECSVVWFLLSMFAAFNLLNQILRIKDTKWQLVLIALCAALGFFLHHIGFIYYCIPQGLMATGYCYLGCLAKKHKVLTDGALSKWVWAVLAAAAIVQAFFGEVNIAHGTYKLGVFDYLAAGGAGLIYLALGVKVSDLEWKVLEPIKKIGVYTYWIICIHSVEQTCIPWYQWSNLWADHQLRGFAGEILIKCAIYITVCFILKKLTQRKYKRTRQKALKSFRPTEKHREDELLCPPTQKS